MCPSTVTLLQQCHLSMYRNCLNLDNSQNQILILPEQWGIPSHKAMAGDAAKTDMRAD